METSQEETVNTLVEDFDKPQLLDLFFSPRKFFSKTIVEGKNLYLKLVTFIVSVAVAMDRIDQEMIKTIGGRQSTIVSLIDTWWAYWAFCLVMGLIGSFFIWYWGGWWYRKRLVFSGAELPDPYKSRYIYIYASFIHSAPAIIIALLYTVRYTNYKEAFDDDIYLGLVVVIFLFISLITSYIGARTVFVLSKWKARVWLIILPALFYLLVMGTLSFLFSKVNAEQYISNKIVPNNRMITSTDGLYKIKLPDSWDVLKDINNDASIQIGNLDEDLYCIVFSENKQGLDSGVTIDDFNNAVINGSMSALQNASSKNLPPLPNIKFNHRRTLIEGVIENNEITYIIQVTEAKDYFYQIISYAPRSNADKLLPMFDRITISFNEL